MNITMDNWATCGHQFPPLQAFITLGGIPAHGARENPAVVYCLTLAEVDGAELYQQEFTRLEDAVTALNARYGHWDFFDREQSATGGGCDTCQAH